MAVAISLIGLMPSRAEAQYFSSPNWPGVYPGRTSERFDGLPERPVRRRAAPSYPKLVEAPKNDQKPQGPLLITVSIEKQWLKIYDERGLFAESPISSGTKTHPTPMGVFSILEKSKWHRSNLYSSAPMPFMQRITWSGVALHAGELPGYPASHGCIRLPAQFAARLWNWTKRGARVIVAPGELSVTDVSHRNLVAALPSPIAALPATSTDTLTGVRTADASGTLSAGIKSDASRAAPFIIESALRGTAANNSATKVQAAETKITDDEAVGATPAEAKPSEIRAEEKSTPDAAAKTAHKTDESLPAVGEKSAETANPVEQAAAVDQKPATDGGVSNAETAEASDGKALDDKTIDTKQPSDDQPSVTATTTPDAKNPKIDEKSAAIPESPKEDSRAPTIEASAEPTPAPAWMQLPKRPGQVSVLISRKDGKLYMRQNFDPVFETQVTFTSDAPIGTHVFTVRKAVNDNTAFEWTAVTMPGIARTVVSREPYKTPKGKTRMRDAFHTTFGPTTVTATEALDRISIPEEALQRIAYHLSPGSSIVVSDLSFNAGGETGRGTEFIVPLR